MAIFTKANGRQASRPARAKKHSPVAKFSKDYSKLESALAKAHSSYLMDGRSLAIGRATRLRRSEAALNT